MTVFADASAIVKLYVDEAGHELMRELRDPIVIAQLSRVEVPSAFWRKHRSHELTAEDAVRLVSGFEYDYYGTEEQLPRFATIRLVDGVLGEAALLAARTALRASDAIQLASALAARRADHRVGTLVAFDAQLRTAAAVEGFAILPVIGGS